MRRFAAFKFLTVALATGVALSASGVASADPVWDRIKASGKLVCGAIPNDPIGSWIERGTGQWQGYEIELCKAMAADLSKEMGKTITPEFKETSWKTIVLDVQAEKIDIWPGMSATPEREKALSMVGPMYVLTFCGLPNKNFQGAGSWESLNKSGVRIATVTGSSVETTFKKFAPNATHMTFTGYDEVMLAVQSGRADVAGADVLRCLSVAKDAPTVFGKVTFPTPTYSMGSSAGVLKSADQLSAWLAKWAKEKQASGAIKKMFTTTLDKAGFDTSVIPPEVSF